MPTMKQIAKWDEEYQKEKKEFEKQLKEKFKDMPDTRPSINYNPNDTPPERCDSPYAMEDSTATFLWIVIMAIGTIFKGNWIIWIIATIIWRKYVTRHKIKN